MVSQHLRQKLPGKMHKLPKTALRLRTAQTQQTAPPNNHYAKKPAAILTNAVNAGAGMNDDRIFERNKLESPVDLLKNRSGGYRDRFFPGSILCP